MPYKSKNELPERVKNVLPPHAQDIFMKAYDNAMEQYSNPSKRRGNESQEETAFKVAWSAVEKEYEKGPSGKWQPERGGDPVANLRGKVKNGDCHPVFL